MIDKSTHKPMFHLERALYNGHGRTVWAYYCHSDYSVSVGSAVELVLVVLTNKYARI